MNKETTESLDFKKKPYATPQMEVYKVKSANIIATSTQAGTESLTEENYNW